MSRCAGLDPVDGSWLPPCPVVVGSQTVVVGVVVVVGALVVVGVVVVVGALVVVGVVVVGSVVVGASVVVVGGSQIVVVVGAGVIEVNAGVVGGGTAVGGAVVGGAVVGGASVVVGWAAWRRTGTTRTTLPELTVAHSLARRRALLPLPFLEALVTFAHDLARRRSPAQLPCLQPLVGRRSLAHSRVFQALAVACAWSLPLRRGLALVVLGCPASAGAAMSPATSRAPKTTASDDGRRTGSLMLRFSIAVSNDTARPPTGVHDPQTGATAPAC
jgi:hypothetical protein